MKNVSIHIDDFRYFISATFGKTLTSDGLLIIHTSGKAEIADKIPEVSREVV